MRYKKGALMQDSTLPPPTPRIDAAFLEHHAVCLGFSSNRISLARYGFGRHEVGTKRVVEDDDR